MTLLLESQSPYSAFYFQQFLLLKSNEEQKDSTLLLPPNYQLWGLNVFFAR